MGVKRICVYAGSSFGALPEYGAAAQAFGAECARRGLVVVYGGGCVGLMGLLANAALESGGEVVGIIPRKMIQEERAHRGLTQLIVVETMHERKFRMAELSDAFVALPGGIGTLEEVAEMFTWLQLGLHLKPVGLLNTAGFYDLLVQFLLKMREEEFLTEAHHQMLAVETQPGILLERLANTRHLPVRKPIQPVTNSSSEGPLKRTA